MLPATLMETTAGAMALSAIHSKAWTWRRGTALQAVVQGTPSGIANTKPLPSGKLRKSAPLRQLT